MSTALDSYLKREGITDADFALKIGRDRSMVSKLRRGLVRPTIDTAAAIETHTDGNVAMQSWISPDPDAIPRETPATQAVA
jgi:transcriptional regulator with XRE-family HTH domain